MTFLPIVGRELRVWARRRSTYWTRSAMGLACVALGVFLQFDLWAVPPRMLGRRIFNGLGWVALVYALFAGRRSTADSISEEKREGTLGLLFLTDLKGYDVVLGKLAATSLQAFYGLLAVVPVLAIPLLMGGISNGEFWRVVLVLVSTFVLSLAVGIAVSTFSHDSRQALGFNLLALLLVIGGPPAVAGLIAVYHPSHTFIAPLFFSCPLYSFSIAEDTFYTTAKWNYWGSIAALCGLSWVFLAFASAVVPHSWQDKAAITPTATRGWHDWWHQWTYGSVASRSALRKRLLGRGPYLWLSLRARWKPVLVWLPIALVAACWSFGWLKSGGVWTGEVLNPLNVGAAVVLNSSLKLWLAIEAGRQIAEDRKTGAFELLLTTPLRVGEIIRGQWQALKRLFFWPMALLLVSETLFMIHDWRQPRRGGDWEMAHWLWAAGIVMLVFDCVALGWASMYASLRSRSVNQATVATLTRILVVPWLLMWLVAGVAGFIAGVSGTPGPEWPFFLGWWWGAGLLADLLFGGTGWFYMRRRFRELAAHSPTAASGFWHRRKVE